MAHFHPWMTNTLDDLLSARELELCAMLALRDAAMHADADAAQAECAALELEQVLTARQRLHDQEYGRCLDCGEPIDLKRLQALPAAPCCTSCQSVRERGEARSRLH